MALGIGVLSAAGVFAPSRYACIGREWVPVIATASLGTPFEGNSS